MAISTEQRALRAGRIGSSDAPRIMAGRWRELWAEKTGRIEAPNLDLVPAVQIGIATEHLHARFYAHRSGIPCLPAGERTFVHPEHEFLVAHPDFLTWREPPADYATPTDTVLEAKFHAGFKSDEELAEQYYWQVQHQMMVGGFAQAVLSILRPGGYSWLPVARDEADIATLLETLRAFWWHVENDIEPGDPMPAVAAPDFERLKVLNMARHNEFMSVGGVLVENRAAFLSFRAAETAIKGLMPEQARVAFLPPAGGASGQGVVLTRARDGKLSLRFGDVPKRHRDKAESWQPESDDMDAGFDDQAASGCGPAGRVRSGSAGLG